MGFVRRLFGGKGDGRPETGTSGGQGDGRPVCISTKKEDSFATHIDRIQASGCIPPERCYQGLFIYALRVQGTASFLSHFQPIMQKAVGAAARGDPQGTVLELKDAAGSAIPQGMLLRILGLVSYEGTRRDGELVLVNLLPPGPELIIGFVLRGDPGIPDGEMKTDPAMVKSLKDALGAMGRLPSASTHARISRTCRPGIPLSQLPRLVGMISENLRGEGIPEPNILDLTRAYLAGTCPSCHRGYSGEEIVFLCGLKQSQKILETKKRIPEEFVPRKAGEEKDLNWLLHRLNLGICLNPSCKSAAIDLSWNEPASP